MLETALYGGRHTVQYSMSRVRVRVSSDLDLLVLCGLDFDLDLDITNFVIVTVDRYVVSSGSTSNRSANCCFFLFAERLDSISYAS